MAYCKRIIKLTCKISLICYIMLCIGLLLRRRNVKNHTQGINLVNTSTQTELFSKWQLEPKSFCGGNITFYSNVIVCFSYLTVNPKFSRALSVPGVKAMNVLNQKEDKEFYNLQPGFFQIHCKGESLSNMYHFGSSHVHGKWEATLRAHTGDSSMDKGANIQPGLTVALERQEYANVYWTLMDLYDVFITCRFLNHSAADTNILIIDARPEGHLDSLWNIFGSVKRPNNLTKSVIYNKLSWRFSRDKSPLLVKELTPLPLIKEFTSFVLSSFDLPYHYQRNCGKLKIFFLWRRDYVAHPRNPTGKISRKITNEDQLLKETAKAFPSHKVTGLQLDSLDMKSQLRIISQTDIFIGMHGAGLTFSMFLPDGSALIEMFPAYYKSLNWHMEYVAKRSNHEYITWRNTHPSLDNITAQSTTVPTAEFLPLVEIAIHKLCGK